jgi:putative ABC transport system permease protein
VNVWHDLRYGARMLARSPAVSAISVIVLALGIGADTAIFSAVNTLLLNPFPFPESDRIVAVQAAHVSGQNRGTGYRDFLDWREQNAVFEEMAIIPWTGSYTLTGRGDPRRVVGGISTAGLIRVLDVRPALGRFFSSQEDRPGGTPVAVLSDAFWRTEFGGRADALGQVMMLDDTPYTIIGVMPRRFVFPGVQTCAFWAPLRGSPESGRYQHQYGVIARLRQGISVERAKADMIAITRGLERQYPETNKGWSVKITPIRQSITEQAATPIAVLFSAVVFVLLLACANVAGLMLARCSARTKENAIRASLGASRGRLLLHTMTETTLLALLGGALGIVVALWLMDLMRAAAPRDFALDAALRIDGTVLGFTLAVSLLTGAFCGFMPAWHGSRVDLNTILKGGVNEWRGISSRNRSLSALIVFEIALTFVLLVGAGLLIKDLSLLMREDTGIRSDHVLTFALDLPRAKYPTAESTTAFYRDLLARLRTTRSVEAAGAIGILPMTGGYSGGGFEIEGRAKPADWMDMHAQYSRATPGYLRAMGIPLLRGRDFDERDSATTQGVAIIDEALARRFFAREDPIGHRVRFRTYGSPWQTIVGIAASVKHSGPRHAIVPQIYLPFAQLGGGGMWIAVRTSGDPKKTVADAREIVRAIDRYLPILRLRPMQQVIADSLSAPRLVAWLLAAFASFALALSTIALYGVIWYSVRQRFNEIGVRIALGATYRNVMVMVIRKAAVLGVAGVSFGLIGAFAASQSIASLLYVVSAQDGTVFVGIPILLILVALLASYLPARRAAKLDPMVALHHE